MRPRLAGAFVALLVPALALVGALVGEVAGGASAQAATSNGGYRVMPLGDSITFGLGAEGSYRLALWQKLAAAGAKVDLVGSESDNPTVSGLPDGDHEGHSQYTVQQMIDNVDAWQRTAQPSTILLHIGTNDMWGSDPSGASARLATLVDRIVANNPNVYLYVASIVPLGFGSFDKQVQAYNAKVPSIVAAKAATGARVSYVDAYSALTAADLADGVHPTAAGYAKLATAWWSVLQKTPASWGGVVAPGSTSTSRATSTTTTTTSRTTSATSATSATRTTTTTTSPAPPTTTSTTTRTTTTSTTSPTSTTSTTTLTTTAKPTKLTTVKKCKTGKNGKKTCKTIIKTVKVKSSCAAAVTGLQSWPGGSVATVQVSAEGAWTATFPASAGVTQSWGASVLATPEGVTASGSGPVTFGVAATSALAAPVVSCA